MKTSELIEMLRQQAAALLITGNGDSRQYVAADQARRRLEAIMKAWAVVDCADLAEALAAYPVHGVSELRRAIGDDTQGG